MENEAQNQPSDSLLSPFLAPVSGEPNVYKHFFKNLLNYSTVEDARESISKIDRLYDYFERLDDWEGMHQAQVLALTGKNRARWNGNREVSQLFAEWLATRP